MTPSRLGDGCPDCIGTRVRGKLTSKEVIVRQIRPGPRQCSPSMLRRTQHVRFDGLSTYLTFSPGRRKESCMTTRCETSSWCGTRAR